MYKKNIENEKRPFHANSSLRRITSRHHHASTYDVQIRKSWVILTSTKLIGILTQILLDYCLVEHFLSHALLIHILWTFRPTFNVALA